MELVQAYFIDVLKYRYAAFVGRARRSEFWYFTLFSCIINAVLTGIGQGVLGTTLLASLYSLAICIPSLALAVRRLHDIGKSGWWLLLILIPLLGWAILLYFYVLDSQSGSNQYGSNPKQG